MVEMLLYVALFAITASALSSVYASSLATDQLAKRTQDLVETRRRTETVIQETLRSAGTVSEPAAGTGTILTVDGQGLADGPVSFYVTDGILRVDTASGEPQPLTPPDIAVEGFSVTRAAGSPPGVGVTFTLSATSGSNVLSQTSNFLVTLRYE